MNLEIRRLLDYWKTGFGCTEIAVVVEASVGIFVDLFGSLKVSVESIAIVILAVNSSIILTDLGARFVNAATVVFSEVFTGGVHQKEPIVVFCEHRGILMQ